MKKVTLSAITILFVLSGILIAANKGILFNTSIDGTATIKGIVTDMDITTPIKNATVTIDRVTSVSTNEKGEYTFEAISGGKHTIAFSAKGYTDKSETIDITDNEIKTIDISLQVKLEIEEVEIDDSEENEIRKDQKNKVCDMAMPMNNAEYKTTAGTYGSVSFDGYDEDITNFNTESYNVINESGFKKVVGNPLSTFSIDVDNASYSNIRRYISYGQTPPKDAVRIEEMLNYFDYDYVHPTHDDPFAINTEISDCPWNASAKLIMVGLQGKDIDYSKADASNLVFLIDVSGSMEDANKLPLVKKSLEYLIDNLSEKDKVSLVVYAGAAGVVLPATSASNKGAIKKALNALQAGGSTAGGEGINLAYKIATDNFIKGGNNRVILCTDGDFNIGASSDAEMTRLIEEKRNSGVFISICGFGMGNYKDSKMESIADNGNGAYYYIDNENEAKKVFVTDIRGTLFTIAKDVKIQVEFNPAKVSEYRLIGYENRLMNKEDFDNDKKDAGELGAGHKVTALYEVILKTDAAQPKGTDIKNEKEDLKYQSTNIKEQAYYSEEIMSIKLRYKKPDSDVSKLIESSLIDKQIPLAESSDNFRYATAVIEFGMLLRDSDYKGTASYKDAIKLANSARGADVNGYRNEFIEMMKTYLGFAAK